MILLVVWMILGQPPQAYHVRFDTPRSCALAKAALEREAERLNAEPPLNVAGQTLLPMPVKVSAICVAA